MDACSPRDGRSGAWPSRRGERSLGDPLTAYRLSFDVTDLFARESASCVRESETYLHDAIASKVPLLDGRYSHEVRVLPRGRATEGQVCERRNPPSDTHVDVTEVPDVRPASSAPLTQRDRYWLTPIEVPFYDALRDTGAIFAVQPWIQGVDSRWRPDFMVFYDGGIVVVELDGHESHKTREQRTRDAKRQRWFEARGIRVLRWTGSEVHAGAQECVRELLEIVRGNQTVLSTVAEEDPDVSGSEIERRLREALRRALAHTELSCVRSSFSP